MSGLHVLVVKCRAAVPDLNHKPHDRVAVGITKRNRGTFRTMTAA